MKTTEIIQPTTMSGALAYGGTKNTIPASATGTNNASITEGFPEITQLPVSDGGLPPERADFNGMFYLSTDQRVFLQNGGVITFSEDVSTAIGGYPKNAVLAYFDEKGEYHLAQSLMDDNTYNFVESPEYLDGIHWQKINMGGSSRNIGEIVTSTLPLTDAGLHLLDGSLLQGGGIYNSFVSYIADLYETNSTASYFATEEDWQASVSSYGVCAKYVYNSTDNTVRLPKITGLIEGTVDTNALGQLVEAGLPALTVSAVGEHLHTGTTDWAGNHNHNLISPFNLKWGMKGSGDNWAGTQSAQAYADGVNYDNWTEVNGNHTHTFTTSAAGAHTHTLSGSGLGNSNTVQPQTVKAFVYVVVATAVKEDIVVDIDNIATDLNAKADKADTANNSLSNLTAEGEKHFVNKNQISNCILEVPQRIKLEFLNGVLTLKAGSELLQPDGLEDDGITWKFKYKTIESDTVFPGLSSTNEYTGSAFIYARYNTTVSNGYQLDYFVPASPVIGATAPASPFDYQIFYNTAENKLYMWYQNTWRSDLDIAFPIGDMTIGTSGITSLDNVYNTVSGLANSLMVKEGVKLLMPNGLNADGTLNNIEYIVPHPMLEVINFGASGHREYMLTISSDGVIGNLWREYYFYQTEAPVVESAVGTAVWYNPATNKTTIYTSGTPAEKPLAVITPITAGSTYVTSVNQRTTLNLLKQADKSAISGWGMPSTDGFNLTLGASNSIYEAPANGWFYLDKIATAAGQEINIENIGIGCYTIWSSAPNQPLRLMMPCSAGDSIRVSYSAAGNTTAFAFKYAKGEDY